MFSLAQIEGRSLSHTEIKEVSFALTVAILSIDIDGIGYYARMYIFGKWNCKTQIYIDFRKMK